MFRRVFIFMILLGVIPSATSNVHDVRVSLPAVSIPTLPDIAVRSPVIEPLSSESAMSRFVDAPSNNLFHCGMTSMPTLNFGHVTPLADLSRIETSSANLASILGRPKERIYRFSLRKVVRRYAIVPDPLGRWVMRPLAEGRL